MAGPARQSRPFAFTRLLAAVSAGASFGIAAWCVRNRLYLPAVALLAAALWAGWRAFGRRATH